MADVYGGITSKELLDRLIRDASPEEKEMIYRSYVVAKAIKELDLVEVVRCKDCKYYNFQHHYCEGIGNWFGIEDEWSDNGYCYKGERIENEAD